MVFIKEVFPNPPGKDAEGEWIRLINNGENEVSLDGWTLKDASGKTFTLAGAIEPNVTLELSITQTKITLNNNGDSVILLNSSGAEVDRLSYTSSSEGLVVTAPQFIKEVSGTKSEGTLSPSLISPEGIEISTGINIAPFFVAFAVALAGAVVTGMLVKGLTGENTQ